MRRQPVRVRLSLFFSIILCHSCTEGNLPSLTRIDVLPELRPPSEWASIQTGRPEIGASWPLDADSGTATPRPLARAFRRLDLATSERGGSVLVLDARAAELIHAWPDGRSFVLGPERTNESQALVSPRSLVSDGNELLVVDLRGIVSRYSRSATGIRLVDETMSIRSPTGACRIDSTLFVRTNALADSAPVVSTALDGTRLGAVGRVYESEDPLVRLVASVGHVACDPSTHTVVLAESARGEIAGYAATDGRLIWRRVAPAFQQLMIGRLPSGAVEMRASANATHYDQITHLSQSGLGRVVIEITRHPTQGGRPPATTQLKRRALLELNAQTGRFLRFRMIPPGYRLLAVSTDRMWLTDDAFEPKLYWIPFAADDSQ
jgi:hypothetical protein